MPGEPSSIVLVLVLDVFKEEQRRSRIFSSLCLQNQHSEIEDEFEDEDDREILDPSASARLRIGFRRGSVQESNPAKKKGRQRTTATKSILPLLHSCPGGVCKSAIHSP